MFNPEMSELMMVFSLMFLPSIAINGISWIFVISYMHTKELRIKKLLEEVKKELKDWSEK